MAKEIKIEKQPEKPIMKTKSDMLPVGSVINGVTKAKSLTEYEYKNEREQIKEETELKQDLSKCTLTESEEKTLKEKFVQEKVQEKIDKIMDLIQEFSKEYVPRGDIDRKRFIGERDMVKIAANLFGIDLDAPRKRQEKFEKTFEELTKKKEYVKPMCEVKFEGGEQPPVYTEVTFEDIAKELVDLHNRKNNDYGDAAHQSYKEFGITSYVIRLNDKLNRLKALTKPGATMKDQDESIIDTLKDLAAYAIMAIESMSTWR